MRFAMTQIRIILASTSPRRRELLQKTGLDFEIVAGNYEEDMSLGLAPSDLARTLSLGKAESVAGSYPDAVVIAADTFIVLDGALLGKPHTAERASEMLALLSGRSHVVLSGVAVVSQSQNKSVCRTVETKVYFKNLAPDQIREYVRTGEPLDKAGAYAIQGLGSAFVERIEGDYSNVVGDRKSVV